MLNHHQTGDGRLPIASRIGSGWCNRPADQARPGIQLRRSESSDKLTPDEATLEDKYHDPKSLLNFKPEGAAAWSREHTVLACVGRNACCRVMQPYALLGGWRTIGIKACRMALVNHHQSQSKYSNAVAPLPHPES
jgi:hypothetical protein